MADVSNGNKVIRKSTLKPISRVFSAITWIVREKVSKILSPYKAITLSKGQTLENSCRVLSNLHR